MGNFISQLSSLRKVQRRLKGIERFLNEVESVFSDEMLDFHGNLTELVEWAIEDEVNRLEWVKSQKKLKPESSGSGQI